MKQLLVALVAAGLAMPAFAFGDSSANSLAAAGAEANAGAIAGARADSTNLNSQGQLQGQNQGQSQNQGQTTNVGQASQQAQTAQQGNQQNITFNSPGTVKYEGAYEVKSTPNVIAPNIYPSANCHGSSSVGLAVMGFGASGGTTWVDKDCQMREYARMFHTFGQADTAIALMCAQASLSEFKAVLPACNAKPEPVVITKEVIKEVIKEVPVPVHDGKPGE